jgi:hypothetical protein
MEQEKFTPVEAVDKIVEVIKHIPLNKDGVYEQAELLKHFNIDLSSGDYRKLKNIFTSIATDETISEEQKSFLLNIFKE